jgi:peptidoglycan endopeptidase LytF
MEEKEQVWYEGSYKVTQLPACSGTIYTIKAGDTYFSLAQRFQVSVQAIREANPGVNPNTLRIGQRICIPARPEIPCDNGFIYVIRPGDTLIQLARQFNIPLQSIVDANPQLLNPNRLSVGDNICIPAAPPPGPDCGDGFSYTIRSGDTFNSLARRFNVSVASIQAANPGVDPRSLRVGQIICIPPRPSIECPDGFIYVIQAGDNLFMLANRFRIPLQELLDANPQLEDPARLTVGENICIPRV